MLPGGEMTVSRCSFYYVAGDLVDSLCFVSLNTRECSGDQAGTCPIPNTVW